MLAFLLGSEDDEGVSSLFEHQFVGDPEGVVLEFLAFVVLGVGKEGFLQDFVAFESVEGLDDAVVQ